jgi:hypothetical protein
MSYLKAWLKRFYEVAAIEKSQSDEFSDQRGGSLPEPIMKKIDKCFLGVWRKPGFEESGYSPSKRPKKARKYRRDEF